MADIYPEGPGPQSNTPLRDHTDQAREKLGEAGQAVKQEAAHFAEAARGKIEDKAEAGKETAVSALHAFADAIRKAGEDLGQQDQTTVARLATQAAEGLEGLSRNLVDKRPEDLLNAVRDFGRTNPAAFMAGSVLAGLALGRFARSSAQHTSSQSVASTYGSSQDVTSTYTPGQDVTPNYYASPDAELAVTPVDTAVAGDAGVDALSGPDDAIGTEADRGRF